MTTYDMPSTPGFRNSDFYLETNTQAFESPLTKTGQRLELAGARWVASYSLPPMKREKAMLWKAWFLKLKGRLNTFNAYDPEGKTPRGPATGTPQVKGGGQVGITLLIDGCTPGTFGWLRYGDYFSVNGELKQLTADVDTNGSGEATLNFEPPLRASPPDNTPIITDKPTCRMILTDDSQGSWPSNEVGVYQEKTFTAYEPIV